MSEKKYWQSFAEFKNKEQVQKLNKDEFKEELPFADLDDSVLGAKTARRDFLKYVGFSTAAATDCRFVRNALCVRLCLMSTGPKT
jgi:molybdopterin-containing oxidoreductase family iron-sulfur binding subunit